MQRLKDSIKYFSTKEVNLYYRTKIQREARMKIFSTYEISAIVWLLLCRNGINGFIPLSSRSHWSSRLLSTTVEAPSDVESLTKKSARAKVLEVAKRLHAEYGTQLFEKAPKEELKKAVEDLEGFASPIEISDFLGDWTLLVTTVSNRQGVDTTRIQESIPFLIDPVKKIRSNILDVTNRYLVVQQKVKSTKDDGIVDRIDHTLELEPPKQLRDILDNLPEALSSVNINPLAVTKSKLVLIHNATILQDDTDEKPSSFKTKLTLQSIVWNVAGTSQILDPLGKDILGINIPSLGDFINTAEFENTYMDRDLRVSRGKIGPIEQLRVFVRTEPTTSKYESQEAILGEEEIVDIESVSDIDDGLTP